MEAALSAANATAEPHASGHEAQVDQGLPFVLFMLAAGMFVRTALRAMPRHWYKPPYTVSVMLLAVVAAALKDELGALGRSIEFWEVVHPHVILFVLLPPLIYEDSSTIDFHVFRRVLAPSLLMAFVGVALGVAGLAPIIQGLLGGSEWNWWTSAMLASILSATDPVAVIAVLRDLGAPARLSTLISGESLLNDGSAFVLFLIFKDFATGAERSALSVAGFFVQLSVGGVAFGLAMAIVLYLWLKLVFNDSFIQNTLSLTAAFAVFFLAEASLHVSGVLATVTLGLWMAYRGKYALGHEVEHENHAIVSNIAFAANTMIFALSGVVTYHRIASLDAGVIGGGDWLIVLAIFAAMNGVRLAVVALLFPLLRNLGYGLSWREAGVVVYGGLRGAVGIALALLVEEDEAVPRATRTRLAFHVAGAVSLSLLVNGTTVGWLYRALQPYPPNRYRRRMLKQGMGLLQHHVEEFAAVLRRDWFFRDAQWALVRELVPELSGLPQDPGAAARSLSLTRMARALTRFVRLSLAGDSVHRSRTIRKLARDAQTHAAALRVAQERHAATLGAAAAASASSSVASAAASAASAPAPTGSGEHAGGSGGYHPGGPPSLSSRGSLPAVPGAAAADGGRGAPGRAAERDALQARRRSSSGEHDATRGAELTPVEEADSADADADRGRPRGRHAGGSASASHSRSHSRSRSRSRSGSGSAGAAAGEGDEELARRRRLHITQRTRRPPMPFRARLQRSQEESEALQSRGLSAAGRAIEGARQHVSSTVERHRGDDESLSLVGSDEDEDEEGGNAGQDAGASADGGGDAPRMEWDMAEGGEDAGPRRRDRGGRRRRSLGGRRGDSLSALTGAARAAARARQRGSVLGGVGELSETLSGLASARARAATADFSGSSPGLGALGGLQRGGGALRTMRGVSVILPTAVARRHPNSAGGGDEVGAAASLPPPMARGGGGGGFSGQSVLNLLLVRTQEAEHEAAEEGGPRGAATPAGHGYAHGRPHQRYGELPAGANGEEEEGERQDDDGEEEAQSARRTSRRRQGSLLAAYGSMLAVGTSPEVLVALAHDRQLLLYSTVLNALRAKFRHMFEERGIGAEAMLRLTEAVDLGAEAVGSYRCPLVEALEYVEESAEPRAWMLRLDGVRCVRDAAHFLLYDHLEASVEAWRALILAASEVREDPEMEPALSKDTRTSLRVVLRRSMVALQQMRDEYPGVVLVVYSLLAVKLILRHKRERVQQLFELGVLDEATRDALVVGVDETLFKIQALTLPRSTFEEIHAQDGSAGGQAERYAPDSDSDNGEV